MASSLHEHLRTEWVTKLDRKMTMKYYRKTNGWNDQKIIDNVLTPVKVDAASSSLFEQKIYHDVCIQGDKRGSRRRGN